MSLLLLLSLSLYNTFNGSCSATVEGLSEKVKTCRYERGISSRKEKVLSKSESDSPGKPTIISAPIPAKDSLFITILILVAKTSLVYLLLIRPRILSHPLCKGIWKWGRIFSFVAVRSISSSVNKLGSIEEILNLSMPGRFPKITNIDARYNNLFYAFSGDMLSFVDYCRDFRIPASSTCQGYSAI